MDDREHLSSENDDGDEDDERTADDGESSEADAASEESEVPEHDSADERTLNYNPSPDLDEESEEPKPRERESAARSCVSAASKQGTPGKASKKMKAEGAAEKSSKEWLVELNSVGDVVTAPLVLWTAVEATGGLAKCTQREAPVS